MPLITITQSIGTQGNNVARLVAKKLGVEIFDDKKLQSGLAKSDHITRTEYHFDHQAPGFWERLRSREPQVYLDTMEAAVYEIARNGEGIIIGHGSQMLLHDFSCAFHVRLLSDVNMRVANLVASQNMSPEDARDLIAKYDKNQKAFFRYAFQRDLDTSSLYDLVINMGKMKTETVADVVAGAVLSHDIQSCSLDALTTMSKLSQERKIHAALLENNIDISTLSITVPEIGQAKVSGVVVSQEELKRVTEILNSMEGISNVNAQLSVWVYPL